MKLIEPNFSSDVLETIEAFKDTYDVSDLESIVILAIKKDGGQVLMTNKTSGEKKAFLLAFFQSWMTKWFSLGNVE